MSINQGMRKPLWLDAKICEPLKLFGEYEFQEISNVANVSEGRTQMGNKHPTLTVGGPHGSPPMRHLCEYLIMPEN